MKALTVADQEISLLFVDNQGIQEINREYLGRNWPTNVISFSLREGEFGNISPGLLGDIVVSVERAAEDALAGGLDLKDEIDFLLIHGLLHLLGYDHENTDDKSGEIMKGKERELFLKLKGINLET